MKKRFLRIFDSKGEIGSKGAVSVFRTPRLPERINHERFFIFCIVTLLAGVSGLRWRVGTDYGAYAIHYELFKDKFVESLVSYQEPGIRFLAKLSTVIFDDYATMIFLSAALTVSLCVLTICKYSRFIPLSIFLYICLGDWHGGFNGVRQFLASAIMFSGHRFIIKRKILQWALIVFVAGGFHITAIVMFPLYFVPFKKINLKHILLLLIASIVMYYSNTIFFSVVEIVKNKKITMNEYATRQVNILRVLTAFAPLVLYAFVKKIVDRQEIHENNFYINMLFINASFMLITINSAYLSRVAMYSRIYSCIAYPILLHGLTNRSSRKIVLSFIVIFYFIFWYITISKSYALNNFQWIFNRWGIYG